MHRNVLEGARIVTSILVKNTSCLIGKLTTRKNVEPHEQHPGLDVYSEHKIAYQMSNVGFERYWVVLQVGQSSLTTLGDKGAPPPPSHGVPSVLSRFRRCSAIHLSPLPLARTRLVIHVLTFPPTGSGAWRPACAPSDDRVCSRGFRVRSGQLCQTARRCWKHENRPYDPAVRACYYSTVATVSIKQWTWEGSRVAWALPHTAGENVCPAPSFVVWEYCLYASTSSSASNIPGHLTRGTGVSRRLFTLIAWPTRQERATAAVITSYVHVRTTTRSIPESTSWAMTTIYFTVFPADAK